jgi:hypothetical protein
MALDARRAGQSSATVREFPAPSKVVRIDSSGTRDRLSADGWQDLRGTILARETVELVGGFPGSATHANRFRRARLAISKGWMIVNDVRVDGFAIPFDHVESLSVVPGSARSRYAIQIRYRDGLDHRNFFIRFADAVWPFRAGNDALRIAELLAELGVAVCQVDLESNHLRLAMTAEEMRAAALETMVWSGDLSAPVGGWLGQGRAACQAWLTTSSFIWRRVNGTGVNRIALSDLIRVSTGTWIDSGPYPVVMLVINDPAGDRHELPFVFDSSRLLDENRRECAAMLGGLRMRDIPVAGQNRPLQPWNDIGSLLTAADATFQMDDATAVQPQPERVSAGAFEAQCLIEIARLNRDVMGHDASPGEIHLEPVTKLTHAAAVEELERRYQIGEIGRDDVAVQRRRFSALIEARGKLAAIAEQRRQGIRPTAILMHQRAAVMSALNEVIMEEPGVTTQPPMKITSIAPPEQIQPRLHLRLLPNPNS